MKYRFLTTILFLVFDLIPTTESYIFTGSKKIECKENINAFADVISAFAKFYSESSFNTTMFSPPKDFLRVDEKEYFDIRRYCTNYKTKFQNILDFKFQGTSAHYSTSYLSTCPWMYVDNYDKDRFPQLIYEAKCVCTCCLHKTSAHEGVQYVPWLGRCKPVMTSEMTKL